MSTEWKRYGSVEVPYIMDLDRYEFLPTLVDDLIAWGENDRLTREIGPLHGPWRKPKRRIVVRWMGREED